MSREEIELNLQSADSWSARFYKGVFWGGVIVLAVLVVGVVMSLPTVLGNGGKPSYGETQAMKDVGYALFNFESDYGSYPNDETAVKIAEKYPDETGLLNPKSAEDYFRQLVVLGYLEETVLERFKEENIRLTYVVWQEKMPTETVAPLLLAPMLDGQRKFDRAFAKKKMGKKALRLSVDMAISDMRVDRDGNAQLTRKIDFFDANSLPWWNEQEWKLAWPE